MTDFFHDTSAQFDENFIDTHDIDELDRPEKQKYSRKKAIILAIVLAFVFFPISAGTTYAAKTGYLSALLGIDDYEGTGTSEVIVEIPEGASGTKIAQILVEKGVVKTESAFIKVFNSNGRSSAVQPGKFYLKKEMSSASALSKLLDPSSRAEVSITILPGMNKTDAFERIASAFSVSADEVAQLALDGSSYSLPPEAGGEIEGWLAPDTYKIDPKIGVTQFLKNIVAQRVEQLENLNFDRSQWKNALIKASIVTREAPNTDDERAKVARVIENRLEQHVKLQMDSTVLYGVGKSTGSPTQEEVRTDTPYNTYTREGLTPTPIGNPSQKALYAVAHPADGKWLFFVTVNLDNGQTKYAETYEEHQKNVQEYRDWVKEHRS
ncbi:MAG: endolytic transglycosylase MltG [Actinomycetaceae bacterium]|nr:endolytic transglycosylase MltG [Actinomycetaceae bacterium]